MNSYNELNYLALYLCICKKYSISRALRAMKINVVYANKKEEDEEDGNLQKGDTEIWRDSTDNASN